VTTVLRTVAAVRAWRQDIGDVAFVPTMGALHEGHLSLVDAAHRAASRVCASIFVNPMQFGPREDFAAYPRDEEGDVRRLTKREVDAVFIPSVEEMYPAGDQTRVRVGVLSERLEGHARPGHFEGVATVVAKLFLIVQPTVALFGQKDFQQLRVIQRMARDLRFAVRILGCPTVREPDGLALSSRNRYLSAEERTAATALSRGLFAAQAAFRRGERDARELRRIVEGVLEREPLCHTEYVSAADPVTLEELQGVADRVVLSLAARFGKARLIDNVLLGMRVEELGDQPGN
jgi:pantoate--beta-alanine ligase